MRITPRDENLLQSLSSKVRLLSLEQIATHWWPRAKQPRDAARRRLRQLEEASWVVRIQPQARELPPIERAVSIWKPGAATPDFDAVASRVQRRWTGPTKRTTAFVLGPAGDRYYGTARRGRLKYEFQATHDLGVATMYLRLVAERPQLTEHWIGEDTLAPHRMGEKLPDAVIAKSPQARPQLVLEFGGAYDARRIEAFHHDCAEQQLPYELW